MQDTTDLLYLINQYPTLSKVFMVIGISRIIFKFVFSFLVDYTKRTQSKTDDIKLEKIMNSKIYGAISFIFDYFLSVKLPQIEKGIKK